MTARVAASATFPVPPVDVAAGVLDRRFHAAKLDALGGRGARLDRFDRTSDGGLEIALRVTLARSALPAGAQRLVRTDLPLRRREHWTGAPLPTCHFEVTLPGIPVATRGTLTLTAQEGRTHLRVEVAAKVTIPFLARAVDGVITEVMQTYVDTEINFAREWFGAAR